MYSMFSLLADGYSHNLYFIFYKYVKTTNEHSLNMFDEDHDVNNNDDDEDEDEDDDDD